MRWYASISVIHIELRRYMATHILDRISCQHVSDSHWAQEVHRNSQAGCDFMPAYQWFTLRPGGAPWLTSWMRFQASMSVIHIEPRRCTATHCLDGILYQHVSESHWAKEVRSGSPPEWDLMPACQRFTLSPGGAQQLTNWMGFYAHILVIHIDLRTCTSTHILDGISCWHISDSN